MQRRPDVQMWRCNDGDNPLPEKSENPNGVDFSKIVIKMVIKMVIISHHAHDSVCLNFKKPFVQWQR